MNGYYRQLIDLIQANNGYRVGPAKGSHEKWGCNGKVTIVPFNCPSRHTANDILKALKIKHKF